MIKTAVCDKLNIKHPIVLGGMALATSPSMVAAVSEAGGLGILGVTALSAEEIHKNVESIKLITDKPFGINYLLFKIDDDIFCDTIKDKIPVVSLAWARPDQDLRAYFNKAHDVGSIVMYMVGDVSESVRAVDAGADIIVAQGTEGGGHVRSMATFTLLPMVVDAVKPCHVLAAGGIADGRGLVAALALGAEGVLMGTRFLATKEAPIHTSYKEAIVESTGNDTILSHIPDLISQTTWPGGSARTLQNDFIEYWRGREDSISKNAKEINKESLMARKEGDIGKTSILVGQNAGLIDSIMTVNDVIVRMVEQAGTIISSSLSSFLK
ncbi:MAG: NAD(P)H-dependent flavin oxidoreductase [Candidatus Anammoxibacter sp.]